MLKENIKYLQNVDDANLPQEVVAAKKEYLKMISDFGISAFDTDDDFIDDVSKLTAKVKEFDKKQTKKSPKKSTKKTVERGTALKKRKASAKSNSAKKVVDKAKNKPKFKVGDYVKFQGIKGGRFIVGKIINIGQKTKHFGYWYEIDNAGYKYPEDNLSVSNKSEYDNYIENDAKTPSFVNEEAKSKKSPKKSTKKTVERGTALKKRKASAKSNSAKKVVEKANAKKPKFKVGDKVIYSYPNRDKYLATVVTLPNSSNNYTYGINKDFGDNKPHYSYAGEEYLKLQSVKSSTKKTVERGTVLKKRKASAKSNSAKKLVEKAKSKFKVGDYVKYEGKGFRTIVAKVVSVNYYGKEFGFDYETDNSTLKRNEESLTLSNKEEYDNYQRKRKKTPSFVNEEPQKRKSPKASTKKTVEHGTALKKRKASAKSNSAKKLVEKAKNAKSETVLMINKIKNIKNFSLKLSKSQMDEYLRNESKNYHSENLVLLAQISKNKDLIAASKFMLNEVEKQGGYVDGSDLYELNKLLGSKLKVSNYGSKTHSRKSDKKPKTDPTQLKIARLTEENKTFLAKVKANAKFKDKIAAELEKHMAENGFDYRKRGLAGLSDADQLKQLQAQNKFYRNLLKGDKADFKAIAKRVGLDYRNMPVKKSSKAKGMSGKKSTNKRKK